MAINVDEAALDSFLSESMSETPASAPAETGAPAAPAEVSPSGEQAAVIPTREETPAATPEADAKVEAAVAATGQSEDKWDPDTRKYIESLRSESARYRQRGQRYNDVFDGYEEDAVNEWLELATTLKNDPKAAAERFQTIAQAILEAEQASAPPVDHASEAEGEVPLTRAQFDQLMKEREAAQDLQRRTMQIELDAKTLGYTPGSDDYDELLYNASRLPNGSIQEAHAKLQAKKQAVIDAYVASLGARPAPTVPDPNGSPASGERKLKSFDEANSALDAWLANQA